MADFGLLFSLILLALTFVIIGMCFIVYMMILGEREKRMKPQAVSAPSQESERACPHHFGYLSGHPVNKPIPEECFGCLKAVQCVNQKETAVEAESAEPTDSVESGEPAESE